MGTRGPIPERSDQRIRRNKDEGLEILPVVGTVEIPELGIPNPEQMTVDFYESLVDSAQAQYYEPSDWQLARFTMHFVDKILKQGSPSAMLLTAINSMLTELLVSEGSRRRVRLEIERNSGPGAQLFDIADAFKQQMQGPQAT